ncbi:MAG: hypothetical protein JRJ54_10645 [Deltaproteobacteria bacterium]|nr:hypothetical protein [Deltaproteobacteria bacterium]
MRKSDIVKVVFIFALAVGAIIFFKVRDGKAPEPIPMKLLSIAEKPKPKPPPPETPTFWISQRNGAAYDVLFRGKHVLLIARTDALKENTFVHLVPFILHVMNQRGIFLGPEALKDFEVEDGVPKFDVSPGKGTLP